MVDQHRLELDELFGRNRNLHPKEKEQAQVLYSDDKVCKYFLVSQCFHDLFPNTQYDDGFCEKDHDELFKKAFEDQSLQKRLLNQRKYITNAIKYIEDKLVEVDNQIRKNQSHLESKTFNQYERPKEIMDRIQSMEQDIQRLLFQSKQKGEEGKIEESERLAEQADSMFQNQENLIQLYENPQGTLKEQSVCDICGALQTINDTDKRTQSHLDGQIHKGFAIIRDQLVRLKARKDELKKFEQQDRQKQSRSRSKQRNKHSKKHGQSKSRSRSRDRKDRDKKHKQKHYHRKRSSSSSSSD